MASDTNHKIQSADAKIAADVPKYDVCVIGAGILGSALSYSLASSGRNVLVLERDLTEPDRIVGELLQPGGCIALRKLGIPDALDSIDAVPCEGYKVFWGDNQVAIPYPDEEQGQAWQPARINAESQAVEDGLKAEGRSFHHGRFVQNLRRKAAAAPNVTLVEATVNELLKDEVTDRVLGVKATPKATPEDDDPAQLDFFASLTIVADGCMSKFRRDVLPKHITPTVRSHFVGLVLEDADLPAPHHGHVILGKADPTAPAQGENNLGPVLVYQLATHETRMLVDVRGSKAPSASKLIPFLDENVTPVLPSSVVPSFKQALERAASGDKQYRLRSMPNSFLPPYPQGRGSAGVFLAGDSLNMRHPLTGGGMTVALNDCVLLTELLGGGTTVCEVEADERGIADLDSWTDVSERLEEWHWERKKVASCINVLAMALYSLFGAEDENLEVLKTGCFKYFELGGDCINGPVSLLSALTPSPILLFYHFFRVAFYSIYIMFNSPVGRTLENPKGQQPTFADYPALTAKAFSVFWTACVVFLPVLWSEGQM
ncbi:Squalene epoxidase [Microbotryomycetes sp. JL221]|nr:Squalene epoxidase [Microbotryomycetes sp. JL221]